MSLQNYLTQDYPITTERHPATRFAFNSLHTSVFTL